MCFEACVGNDTGLESWPPRRHSPSVSNLMAALEQIACHVWVSVSRSVK